MLGYAGTDSPSSLTHWTHKELATDLVNLVGQIAPDEQVILGGHDWGAGLVYKVAMWYPDLVKAFFTIAVPYMPPWLGLSTDWRDLSDLVADGTFPTLGYQLQWRDPSIDRNFTTPSQISMMFNTVFGGTTPEGAYGYSVSEGFLYDVMPLLGPNPLVNSSDMDLYVNSIARHGVRGVFNWYRTRRMDWEDELPLAREGTFRFRMPSLFIPALKDISMPEEYYRNMPEYFDSLAIRAVDAGHWTHWEGREEVNDILTGWVKSLN
jgi:pimeloyl-ACP methyl ester carboxylesterase